MGKGETFVSTDIESDGPIPGANSMPRFASVALDDSLSPPLTCGRASYGPCRRDRKEGIYGGDVRQVAPQVTLYGPQRVADSHLAVSGGVKVRKYKLCAYDSLRRF